MKKIIVFICLLTAALDLYADPVQEDYRNADTKARISYALGMLFGSNLSAYPLELDFDAFTEGFRTMFENAEPQFTRQEAEEYVENAMRNVMEKINEENRIREETFLHGNSQREEVKVTSSGLQYEVLVETDGEKPALDSTVKVNYTGKFIDGSVFDNSGEDGVFIPLDMVIEGWTEALLLMSQGSKYIVYIPSSLAYGQNGIQNIIPPYSTLIFEVELLEILSGEEDPPQQ
jgi:FKBP-type peptidyl-prolyl cis-trans isomerase FkpA